MTERTCERPRRHLAHFEALAPEYARYRRRYRYYWDGIAGYLNFFLHEDDTVLEVGCGGGDTLAQLKGKRRAGIDFSPAMIEHGRRRHPGLELHVMPAEDIALDETFDVVIISNVIGFLEDVTAVLRSVRRVCHERTRVLISHHSFLWEPVLELAERTGLKRRGPKQSWLTGPDIRNLLYLCDFDAYRSDMRTLLPVGVPLVSTVLNRIVARLPGFRRLCLNSYIHARPTPRCTAAEVAERHSVSVVIPARNESGNIAHAIERLPRFGSHLEVLFVEGGSTDDTWERIGEVQQRFAGTHDIKRLRQDGKGKGDAVRKGYAHASGEVLMILDADLTVPPEDLPSFYDALATGKAEFVNGSRLVYPMERGAMRHLNTIGNKFFSLAFSWLLGQPIKDTLCGTKVMFRRDYERLTGNRSFFGDFDPFGDYDLLFGAFKLNLKIVDLPVRYRERTYGETNISRFRHGLLLLRMCAFAARKIKFS